MAKRAIRKKTARKKTARKKTGRKKTARKKSTSRRGSGKRQVLDTGRNKMYGRRNARGKFTEMDDVGRSLTADRRQRAKRKAPKGQGDRGDQ